MNNRLSDQYFPIRIHYYVMKLKGDIVMVQLGSVRGTVRNIQDFHESGCVKLVAVETEQGSIVNMIIEQNTYVVDQTMLSIGDQIITFYDLNAPVITIYPPQYRAEIVVKVRDRMDVYVGYFTRNLISIDNEIQLNISRSTRITTRNGQLFTNRLDNRMLIVIYGAATKSIPAQVTPSRIIVQC